MVEHRRTPGGGVFVPAGWLILLALAACVAAAGWLGYLVLDPSSEDEAPSAAPTTSATPTPAATTSTPSPTPTPQKTTKPTPAPTTEKPEPQVTRNVNVAVFNNTRITRLAASVSGRASAAGWPVVGTGNWRGQIGANTVYYPGGFEPQARLLARDLGIAQVQPGGAGMRTDRLTVVLSGPQQ